MFVAKRSSFKSSQTMLSEESVIGTSPCCCCWAGESSCLQSSAGQMCACSYAMTHHHISVILHEEVCWLFCKTKTPCSRLFRRRGPAAPELQSVSKAVMCTWSNAHNIVKGRPEWSRWPSETRRTSSDRYVLHVG